MWKCCLIARWLSQVLLAGENGLGRAGRKRMTMDWQTSLLQRIITSTVTPLDGLDEVFLGIRARKRLS